MSESAWLSLAFWDSRLWPGLGTDNDRDEHGELISSGPYLETCKRFLKGIPLTPAEYPTGIFPSRSFTKPKKSLALMAIGPGLCGNRKMAEFLSGYAFGPGCSIFPVKVYDFKGEAELAAFKDNMFFLNIAAQKRTFQPQLSKGLEKPGRDGWLVPLTTHDDDMVVTRQALDGPDVWMEPDLYHGLFLSERLVRGLKAARLDRWFRPLRCRVVGDGNV